MPGERAAREQQVVGPAAAAVLLVRRLGRALDAAPAGARPACATGGGEAAGALDLVRARARSDVLELVHLDPRAAVLGGLGGGEEDPHRDRALLRAGVLGAQAPQERLVVAVLDAVGLGHAASCSSSTAVAGVGLEARARPRSARRRARRRTRTARARSWSAKLSVVDVAVPAPEERVADRGRGVADVARVAAAVRRHHEGGDDVAVAVVPDVAPQRAGRSAPRARPSSSEVSGRGPAPFSAAPAVDRRQQAVALRLELGDAQRAGVVRGRRRAAPVPLGRSS